MSDDEKAFAVASVALAIGTVLGFLCGYYVGNLEGIQRGGNAVSDAAIGACPVTEKCPPCDAGAERYSDLECMAAAASLCDGLRHVGTVVLDEHTRAEWITIPAKGLMPEYVTPVCIAKDSKAHAVLDDGGMIVVKP